MSSGFSNGIRVFRACRALLAPSKSSATVAATAAKSNTTSKPKPKSKVKTPPTSDTADVSATPKPKIKREITRPTGILKVTQVSPALSNFLGVSEASRIDAVKQIWSYIKLHNLQNPANKREIYCDDKLKAIFEGREKVGFLEIGKLLAHHFVKN
ncbi:upstream activation factor subunit UAF30 [Benincasa hispida]|uniref:upstream activation factor subunit UAF30 n=1 Tax=Benincasa hispida TaxID=102211 RepID=UPI001900757F|nr:upstream activation factor subunit UAF30 [Benincasa hispida]XP_038877226.1 upstream activation factor subunit UAF30 [Benincasa hispida]